MEMQHGCQNQETSKYPSIKQSKSVSALMALVRDLVVEDQKDQGATYLDQGEVEGALGRPVSQSARSVGTIPLVSSGQVQQKSELQVGLAGTRVVEAVVVEETHLKVWVKASWQ